MKTLLTASVLGVAGWLAMASATFAGAVAPPTVGAPAPLLGAGLPGLAILAAAGAGYLTLRLRRRGRD